MTDAAWAEKFDEPRKFAHADESILHEMRLAPRIKDALASEEVQQRVRALGFAGVSFVEPILGVVSRAPNASRPYVRRLRQLGQYEPCTDKFLVYEYVSGKAPRLGPGHALAAIVGSALCQAGIRAQQHGDLRNDQFLIDRTGWAHLLDAERYANL